MAANCSKKQVAKKIPPAKKVKLEIEGIQVIVEFSFTAIEKMKKVTGYEAASLVLKLGERVLDFKNNTQFAVIDKELGIGLVCELSAIDNDIFIDVITVISNAKFFISKGLKIYSVKEILEAV